MSSDKIIFQQIIEEKTQSPSTRSKIYEEIEKIIGIPLISYFTSFSYPVMIDDDDADMLEGLLQKTDLSNGFALMISSPGGDGLAAERIINICRTYSGTGDYITIIPGKAKSAATMICLGSSKIILSGTSELGPIDPQFVEIDKDGTRRVFSAYNLVSSYKKIFENAIKETGRIEPYLQALDIYDARQIEQCLSEMELSQDIALKALKTGMLDENSKEKIIELIKIFLIPEETKVHSRPIYYQDAKSCSLNLELKEPKEDLWTLVYELYLRLNTYVSSDNIVKCIESSKYSFHASYNG